MIYRFMFKGYYNDKEFSQLENSKVKHTSLFSYDDMVFLYFESLEKYVDPETVVKCNLKKYPNGEAWERMTEVFHYCKALSEEQWERKIENKKPWVRVNTLQYDKIASYIFYHHQYQEEHPCDGDKYGIIFLSGNFMVFYSELPEELEEPRQQVNILPNYIPDWGALMTEHFSDEPTGRTWVEINEWKE